MDQIRKLIQNVRNKRGSVLKKNRLKKYHQNQRKPWSEGYEDFKWDQISEILNNQDILKRFAKREPLHKGYGSGLDERIVEYPFVFSRIENKGRRLLDAGSTFNFLPIINHPLVSIKKLTIFTAFPEKINFIERKISYEFGDLRNLPFKQEWFDEIVCMSTLEHIGMDNAIYGYGEETIKPASHDDNTEYLLAVTELERVLKPGGSLYITVPFGKKMNYGYFQQFDGQMIASVANLLHKSGTTEITYFKYESGGWQFSEEKYCSDAEAFNPITGQGRGTDGAAHSRAICGIQFIKERLR